MRVCVRVRVRVSVRACACACACAPESVRDGECVKEQEGESVNT